MRRAVARVLLLAAAALAATVNPVTQQIIDEVNRKKTSWYAGENKFSSWTQEQLKCLVGTAVPTHKSYTVEQMNKIKEVAKKNTGIPDSFDSRTQWPGCVHPIRDQAQCGSCWAFGASESLSDRFCVASNGSINVVLSPQDLVSCDSSDYGCDGGYLQNAWAYMTNSGVVPDWCFPYTSQGGVPPMCATNCVNNQTIAVKSQKYKASSYYAVGSWIFFWDRVSDIQKEVMKGGPIEVAFSVYQDFLSYKGGVYQYTSGGLLGGHAVKLVGWGVDQASNLPYWIIANSWSETWGEKGYFRILRGKNECGIEAGAYSGIADVQHAPKL